MPVFDTPRVNNRSPKGIVPLVQQTHDSKYSKEKVQNTGHMQNLQKNHTNSLELLVDGFGTMSDNQAQHYSDAANRSIDKDTRTTTSSENDEKKQLYMFLNSIVLQYLEILGLQQTIETFIQESQDEGYAVPPSLSTVDKFCIGLDSSELRPRDVEQLLKHFDDENANTLLEKWKYIRSKNKLKTENRCEELRLNVHLRIYIYITIPFRQSYSDDDKQVNIQHLIEEFKAKNHDDVNDPEILSLYALPYVTNPVQHPVFSKFFTTNWIENLRNHLKTFCQSLCKRLPDPFETDLAKLYRLWSNTNLLVQNFSSTVSNPWNRSRTSDALRLTPANVKVYKLPEDSPFKILFDNILQMKQENEKIKAFDKSIKTEYMQKIQLCDALVTCLKELYSKNDHDRRIPWDRVIEACCLQSLPESTYPSEHSLLERSDSVLANGINQDFVTDSGTSSYDTIHNPEIKPETCQHQQHAKVSPRSFSSLSLPPRPTTSDVPITITRIPVGHTEDAYDEPTIRIMRQMLSARRTRAKTPHEDSGTGDFNRQPLFPPPPTNIDNILSNTGPRSLLDMMQANTMLRTIVQESEHLNEE